MRYRIWLAAAIGIAVCGALYSQSGKTVWDGVYTAQQATRGAMLYADNCGSCHSDDLGGSGHFPPLAGEDFSKEWTGQSVGDLFERMSTSMPADRPGKLSKEVDADILAFMLKSNGFPAGQSELKASMPELNQIRWLAVKP